MFGFWGNKNSSKVNSRKAYKKVLPKVSLKQGQVLKAVQNLGPCNYRQISQHLNVIEGSVTPRIAELRRKGLIKVAYVGKNVLSGTRVNYYAITGAGMKRLIENLGDY